jgi:opacity protein-like surface antigen
MRISLRTVMPMLAAAWCSLAFADATPDQLSSPIDRSSFSELTPGVEQDRSLAESAGTLPIEEVADGSAAASRRFYVTGIVGASFATLTSGGGPNATFPNQLLSNVGSANNTVFTSGGAAGVAFDRPAGLLRVEFEGRERNLLVGQTFLQTSDATLGNVPYAVRAADGWSTMANVWRDYSVSDRFGVYAGGGIGAGGYNISTSLDTKFGETLTGRSSVISFAWQAGGGVTHQFTDRLTLDLGYRFFSLGAGSTPLAYSGPSTNQPFGSYTSAFAASELLLSVRIYEPFRNWRQ